MDFLTGLLALFAFGTIWFWIAAVAVLGWLVYCVEHERHIWSIFVTLSVAALLHFVYGINLLSYTLHHPGIVLMGIVGYFLIGSVWVLIKWPSWVQTLFDAVADRKAAIMNSPVVSVDTYERILRAEQADPGAGRTGLRPLAADDDQRDLMLQTLQRALRERRIYFGEFPPNPFLHKKQIVFWLGFWPASFLWWVLHKPVEYISTFLYHRLTGLLTNITGMVVNANLKNMPTIVVQPEEKP